MGVMHHRKRVMDRVPQGGGLTAVSLTDTATDDDIMEHDSGMGPSGDLGDVTLDYDETYRELADSNDPYTRQEAREDASRFANKPYDRSDTNRDVAQEWRPGTVTLGAGSDPYLLAGADPLRKCLFIHNGAQGVLRTADIIVGNDASLPRGGNGPGFILANGNGAGQGGDSLTLTHTGEVWIVPAVYSGVVGVDTLITYSLERYYR